MNKIKSYVGFAIKAKKVVIGQSLIKRTTQKMMCILLDATASQNLKDLATNVASKQGCALILVENLQDMTHINDLKIIAITDESLGNAIIEQSKL
ncbi:MAG: hypothetical protein IKM43_03325 [Clostridia bacterium]|nr:hypothetical protein [Clostridia bacterium]